MHSITFDKSGNSVVIAGTISYSSTFGDVKNNQYTEKNLLGIDVTYSTGNTICNGILVIKNVSYNDGQLLRYWIRDTIVYMLYTFTLSEASGLVNFGKGKGTSLTNVVYTKDNLKDVLNYEEPGIYTVKFPYRFVRT